MRSGCARSLRICGGAAARSRTTWHDMSHRKRKGNAGPIAAKTGTEWNRAPVSRHDGRGILRTCRGISRSSVQEGARKSLTNGAEGEPLVRPDLAGCWCPYQRYVTRAISEFATY